jgi:hypothetical protein
MNINTNNNPSIGDFWYSQELNPTDPFYVLSGPEAVRGLGSWGGESFVGHRAIRERDKKLCLVGLTKKPVDYEFDFVEV